MTNRNFAPISIQDLLAKIKAVGSIYDLVEHLRNDIKVQFDLENVSDSANGFGPKSILGYHTEANGFTYYGVSAGGDWEHPVFFCVYWDGKKLRGYVPTDGNPWNTATKSAYGNDEDADLKNACKRWPDRFDKDSEVEQDCFDFEPELILQDMLGRILPPGQKLPAKPSKPPKASRPVRPIVPANAIQNRIESLTYYGVNDDGGIGYELFQQICTLSYNLFKTGMSGKSEVACAWAEELAYESRSLAQQNGSENDTAAGHWGQ